MNLRRTKNDIGLSLFLIGVCIAMIWDSWDIPPGSFEPLGAGPIPRLIAYTVIAICLVVLIRAIYGLKRLRTQKVSRSSDAALPYRPRPKDAVVVLGLTIIYVTVMAFRLSSFAVTTTIFLFITISMLMNFERKIMLVAAAIALIMGFGCQYLFTEVFVVDLPAG